MNTSGWFHKVADLADAQNITFGAAEQILEAQYRKDYQHQHQHQQYLKRKGMKRPKPDRVRLTPEPCYTYSKAIRMAKDAGRSHAADCDDDNYIEDAAYDIADCLLYDPMLNRAVQKAYVKVHQRYPSRQTMKEIIADYVHDGMSSVKKLR